MPILPPLDPEGDWPTPDRPTMYFIGVTTHQSSIMRVFPLWAEYLNLGDVALQGINFPLHDSPARYRRAVEFIKQQPLARGALVTTHKLDLYQASGDLFDEVDEFARLMQEVSSIYKDGDRLIGHAIDPINSGLSIETILGAGYWERTAAEVLICGAGGASTALTWYLLQKRHGANRPSRMVVTDRSSSRLDEMAEIHRAIEADLPVEYHLVKTTDDTDFLLSECKPKSVIVNATGLGKDAPGSPISDRALWPEDAIAWDFNYRGDLVFLKQARAQQESRLLRVEDGWQYFLHGWTSVMAEVFALGQPPSGAELAELSQLAAAVRE